MKALKYSIAVCLIFLMGCNDGMIPSEKNDEGGDRSVMSVPTMSYTDDPEHSYFLIRAEDEKVDGKTAFVCWSNSEQQTKSTSVSDGLANTIEISKIVNKRWTFPAFQFAFDLNEQDPEIKEGDIEWYLPSKSESMLMHIFSGCLNLTEDFYWSSSEWINFSHYRNTIWITTPPQTIPGISTMQKLEGYDIHNEGREKGAAVRLVKVNKTEGKKYPYVKSRTEAIIVCRDKDGGIKEEALRKEFPLTATTDKEDNGVSRCFEVEMRDCGYAYLEEAKAMAAEKGEGWRVPTLSEIQLIWAMGGGYNDWGPLSNYTGGWGASVPMEGLNLRDVEGYVPLGDAFPERDNIGNGEYLLSNPGSFYWEENKYWSEYRFLGSDGRIIGGNSSPAKETVRLVRDVVIE